MTRKNTAALLMVAVTMSFLGFVVENIWLCITLDFIDNRNMHLPFLLGYGLGVVAVFALFGTPQQPLFFRKKMNFKFQTAAVAYYYLMACLGVMAGEIALGTLVEKTCNITWWEYTGFPLTVTKFTCVPVAMAFGALITLFMACLFPPLYGACMKHRSRGLEAVAYGLMVLLVADYLASAAQMYQTSQFVEFWRIDFQGDPIYRVLAILGIGAVVSLAVWGALHRRKKTGQRRKE